MSESLLTVLDARATVGLKEVAQRIGIPVSTVRRLAGEGKIGGAFQPAGDGGRWRFKRLELEAWYERQGQAIARIKPGRPGVSKRVGTQPKGKGGRK